MNVQSLRGVGSKEEQEKSAECRIAKVAMSIFFLFTISWLPYAIVALAACFGDRFVSSGGAGSGKSGRDEGRVGDDTGLGKVEGIKLSTTTHC